MSLKSPLNPHGALFLNQQSPTGPCWTLLDPTGPYWTLLDPAGPYWTLLDPTGPYLTLLDPAGPYCCAVQCALVSIGYGVWLLWLLWLLWLHCGLHFNPHRMKSHMVLFALSPEAALSKAISRNMNVPLAKLTRRKLCNTETVIEIQVPGATL